METPSATFRVLAVVLFVAFAIQLASASPIVLNFDSLPAMPNVTEAIPSADQLSNLYLSTYGVSFSSGSPYVAVVDVGFGVTTSGSNDIGGSTPTGFLHLQQCVPHYRNAPLIPAILPENGVTDFVSLRGDLQGSAQNVTLDAYDVNGNLLASDMTADVGGETLSISTPGIHSDSIS